MTTERLPFKDRFPDFQHIAREATLLGRYNLRVAAGLADGPFRLHSFLAINFIALERLLRIVLGPLASPKATLKPLLEQAAGKKGVIEIEDRVRVINLVNDARINVMHGLLGIDNESESLLSQLAGFAFDLSGFVGSVAGAIDTATGGPSGSGPVRFGAPAVAMRPGTTVLTPLEDLESLREWNLRFRSGDPQDELLLLTEGALCLAVIEAAGRRAAGNAVTREDDFGDVLSAAASASPLRFESRQIREIVAVRNGLVHANYEQAAREAGRVDVREYFLTSFASEVEGLYGVCVELLRDGGPG